MNADVEIRSMPYTEEPIVLDEANYRAMVREITSAISLRPNEKSVFLKRGDDAVDYNHLSAVIAMIHKACPINKKAERYGKNADITMMYDIAFQVMFNPDLELHEVIDFGTLTVIRVFIDIVERDSSGKQLRPKHSQNVATNEHTSVRIPHVTSKEKSTACVTRNPPSIQAASSGMPSREQIFDRAPLDVPLLNHVVPAQPSAPYPDIEDAIPEVPAASPLLACQDTDVCEHLNAKRAVAPMVPPVTAFEREQQQKRPQNKATLLPKSSSRALVSTCFCRRVIHLAVTLMATDPAVSGDAKKKQLKKRC